MGLVQHYSALNRPAAPICSVCIANYNGAALLADCLDSIYNQEGDFSIEIIVHDDASTDDSVTLLRTRHPRIEILASAQNVGFCIANNRMIEIARGEFILLLNNDAALYPDALSSLLRAAHAQASHSILTLPQYDWVTGELVDRGCLIDLFYNPTPNLDPERRNVAMTIGACLWIRRDLWNELQGFPEWLGSIAEDLYLCCVARLRGNPVRVTEGSGYRHRQGASFGGNRASASQGLQTTFRRRYLSERNKTSVLLICTPSPLVWPLLALHVFSLCLEGVILTAAKRDTRIWQEIYGATIRYLFAQFRPLLQRRWQIQRLRSSSLVTYFGGFTLIPRKLSLLRRYGIPQVR